MSEQDSITRRARELFENATRPTDPAVGNRLRMSRRAALSASSRRSIRLLPLATAASVLALALAWWLPRHDVAPVPASAPASADQTAIENEEDSEIYAWLSDAPVAPDKDNGDAL